MHGLAMGRGASGGDVDVFDEDEQDSTVRYFHINACGPGGVAEADGGFAKKLLNTAIKFSARNPIGYMEWPRDWCRVKWSPGEICNTGGEDYLIPFRDVGEK